jgi:AAA family ATP:ADP antiporter
LLPVLVVVAVLALKFNPGVISILFWIMVFAKAVNYALNQPTLKQLYIPTTKDTKYKAQAWIEMFGSRGAKAIGSYINTFKKAFIGTYGAAAGAAGFLMLTTLTSLGLVAVWFFVALFVSRTYNKAVEEKRIVC